MSNEAERRDKVARKIERGLKHLGYKTTPPGENVFHVVVNDETYTVTICRTRKQK